MHLSPREQEKADGCCGPRRRRQERGTKLNYPESIAILTYEILEGARDGRSVADLMSHGTTILKRSDVMEGVPGMVHEVQVEATFPDGNRHRSPSDPMIPGEIRLAAHGEPHEANVGLEVMKDCCLQSRRPPDSGRQPLPFFETNSALDFRPSAGARFRLAHSVRNGRALRAGRYPRSRTGSSRQPGSLWPQWLVNGKL